MFAVVRWGVAAIGAYVAWVVLLGYWFSSGEPPCEAACENAFPRQASKWLTVPTLMLSVGLLLGWITHTKDVAVKVIAAVLILVASLVGWVLLWLLTSN